MTKQDFRAHFAAVRGGILPEKRAEKSLKLSEKFLSLPEFKNADTVMLYMSFRSEVETAGIIGAVLASGKRLVLPKCKVGMNEIIPCIVENLNELKEGSYGILEPDGSKVCDKSEIDIVAVPALAFDRENFRLGYGGGYYDRFLKNFSGFSVGLCFSETLTDKLPRGEFDICVNKVLTD